MSNKSLFCERLRSQRKKFGITQKEMAKKILIHVVTYNHYETGRSQPNLDTLILISNILKCSTDFLLGLNES